MMGNRSKHAGGLGRWRRKSPVTAFLAFLLIFAQLQTAFAAITNTATVGGTYNGVPLAPSAPSSNTVPVAPAAPAVTVSKTQTSADFSIAGDIVTFDIIVANTGDVTATAVSVSDPTADSLTCPGGLPIASIAPGASVTCTASDTISAGDVSAGVYSNTVTVSATTPGGVPIGPETATATVNRAQANLVTIKTRTTPDPTPAVGDTVTFAITVTNNGPSTATNVTLDDVLPPGMTVTALNGTVTSGAYTAPTWTIPTLASGASAVLTIQGTVNAGQEAQTITNATTAAVSDQLDSTIAGDDLTESVIVAAPTMAANDDVSAGVNGQAGGIIPGLNVLDNDQLNSAPVNPLEVSIIPVTAGPLTVNADGSVAVAPLTPAGTYLVTYEVCEIADPSNCDTAEVAVTVVTAPIVAIADTPPAIGNAAGGTTPAVLDNDTLNSTPVVPASITLTPGTAPAPSAGSITMNPDGTVTVAPGTTAGTYTYPYTICEVLNPGNCSTTSATITVVDDRTRVSGVVFEDENSNGNFDGGEPVWGGFTVQLVQNGTVIATTVSNPDGTYEFVDVPVGTGYSIAAIDPATGAIVSGEGTFDVAAGEQIADINLPIDPSGVIYDSVTRLPIGGATVMMTDRNGVPLPLVCLASPAQQSQVTGPDGFYRFDVMAGADPACPVGQTEYRLQVTAPAGYIAAPSAAIPPTAGALDASVCPVDGNVGGSCAVQPQNSAPSGAASTIYFLAFLIGSGDPDVVHNHIPLDPIVAVPGDVAVTKRAASQIGLRGGLMTYTITATNNGGSTTGDLNLIDRMPVGFTLVEGSVSVDGAPVAATSSGRTVTLPAMTIPSGARVTVTLQLRIPINAEPGDYVNEAYAADATTGTRIGTVGSATIRIRPEAVFDCGDIIGKVFDDRNGNGIQDGGTSPYEPELGIAGVRLATVKGELITTDKNGQFHVPCAMLPDRKIGSNFILKLDTRTLPTGYRVTTENPRVIRLTAGKMSKLNFGATIGRVVRLDLRGDAFAESSLALRPEWNVGLDELMITLAEENSVLRLTYFASTEEASFAKKRMAQVKKQIETAWKRSGGKYKLTIETELVRKN